MTCVEKSNLVLRFKLAGDSRVHVKGAARIRVDGRGGLMLYNGRGTAEEIDLRRLQSFSIQTVRPASESLSQPMLSLVN
jgi:hypothetical protein